MSGNIAQNFAALPQWRGALCYLDQRKPHTAINAGSTDRIHLVVDAYANDDLRALIRHAP